MPDPSNFVDIQQAADGRVTDVTVHASPPDPDSLITSAVHRTVWHHYPLIGPAAREVFNLVCSDEYRDDNPSQWKQADAARTAFHAEPAAERAFLRTVEAHLILAGHTGAHTAPVTVETHGIVLTQDDRTWFFCRYGDDWQTAIHDGHSTDGWSVINEHLAPPTASAEEVADAIRATLADN
ncbi:hypothetical protein ACWDA7_38990 [Streptomyces sp. NPDC001156]